MEQTQTPSPMVIVAEGMPPIQTKLIEKMHRWEYVDLSKLLGSSDPVSGEASLVIEGNGSPPEKSKKADQGHTRLA